MVWEMEQSSPPSIVIQSTQKAEVRDNLTPK